MTTSTDPLRDGVSELHIMLDAAKEAINAALPAVAKSDTFIEAIEHITAHDGELYATNRNLALRVQMRGGVDINAVQRPTGIVLGDAFVIPMKAIRFIRTLTPKTVGETLGRTLRAHDIRVIITEDRTTELVFVEVSASGSEPVELFRARQIKAHAVVAKLFDRWPLRLDSATGTRAVDYDSFVGPTWPTRLDLDYLKAIAGTYTFHFTSENSPIFFTDGALVDGLVMPAKKG